jgi:hypothetical protein
MFRQCLPSTPVAVHAFDHDACSAISLTLLLRLQDQRVMGPGAQSGLGAAPAAGALCSTGCTAQDGRTLHHQQQQIETWSLTGNDQGTGIGIGIASGIGIGIGTGIGMQKGVQFRQEKQQQVEAADHPSLAA